MTNQSSQNKQGFVAIMAVVVISSILLLLVIDLGFMGWSSRFNILRAETKTKTTLIAQSCAEYAVLSLMQNMAYSGDATTTIVGVSCYIAPLQTNIPEPGMITIETRVVLGETQTLLKVVYELDNIHIEEIPKNSPAVGTPSIAINRVTWEEIENLSKI